MRWYEHIYDKYKNNRLKFIKEILKEKPHLKKNSAQRYFNRMQEDRSIKKKLRPIIRKEFHKDFKIQPSYIKLMEFDDMQKMGYKPTPNMLVKYGYKQFEINWLIENRQVYQDEI